MLVLAGGVSARLAVVIRTPPRLLAGLIRQFGAMPLGEATRSKNS